MLARLARLELIVKRAGSPGSANAWFLSAYGRRVIRAVGDA